ncbi:trigger factor [Ruminococcaceae bacterium OttesenSCG-928-D13]|nr:trigger factor [Ruminococcaceae bacterium OttesenSCG-928-D13]
MKLNKNEKTATNTVELEFSIEPEVLREAISKVYRRDAKKYNVPGFRRGKAPRNRIEQIYGADVFVYDAVNDIFPEAYEEAVKEAGIEPVGRPDVELVEATAEKGAELKAVVTTKPELKIGKYTGLKATKTTEKVDEAKVDAEIERMQERNARLVTREGAAEDGDIANIDFEGFKDDVPFEGGKGENHDLTLGSGSFIPGFEEQVVGHKAGDEFDVKVTFPEEYHSEELKGADAVFKVKVNGVHHKELDALDDEFAKDVSEYDTLDELKKSIRDGMQKELDEAADREVENQLVDQIVETIEGEIPEVMYEVRIDEMVRDFAYRLESQGLNLETYLQYTGMDGKAFRDGFREQAEKQVKMRLALETVVRLEKIEVTEQDIDEEIARIAEKYSMEKDQVKNIMPNDEIAKDLAVNKAIDLVKSKATITEEKAKKAEKKADKGSKDEKPKAEKKEKKPAKKAAEKPAAKEKAAEEK